MINKFSETKKDFSCLISQLNDTLIQFRRTRITKSAANDLTSKQRRNKKRNERKERKRREEFLEKRRTEILMGLFGKEEGEKLESSLQRTEDQKSIDPVDLMDKAFLATLKKDTTLML